MAKTPAEFEMEFIQSVKEKTGKTLEQWLSVVKLTGLSKQMEILNWLKNEHKLNHMQAGFIASIYLNGGKNVYQNEENLLENQFMKCEVMRPVFEHVSGKLLGLFPGTQLIAKKTYLSYTAAREFAAINIKPKEIRLGMDLGEMPFTEIVQKSKLTGPMPRISHMLILTGAEQFDEKVEGLLRKSYERTHKK